MVVLFRYPDSLLAVDKEPGHALPVVGEVVDGGDAVCGSIEQEEAIAQGGYPYLLIAILGHGDHRFPIKKAAKVVVVVKLLFVVIAYGISLVHRSNPKVLIGVAIETLDAEIGHLEGEVVVLGIDEALAVAVVVEEAILVGVDDQPFGAIVADVDDAALLERFALLYAAGRSDNLAGFGVDAGDEAVAANPDDALLVEEGADMGLIGQGDRVAKLQPIRLKAPYRLALYVPQVPLGIHMTESGV